MIQVCSRCATRWNVRDRQRVWCPRCQGSLLAPTSDAPALQWSAGPANGPKPASGPAPASSAPSGASGAPRRLPAGYRWIAVRPGAPPPPRRAQRPLGPTPRYAVIPRWGLQDHVAPPAPEQTVERAGYSERMVRGILVTTLVVFGIAAVVHIARYALLLINRTTLLNPVVAGIATWGGVAASVLAFFTLIASMVVMTNWLINRRAAAYEVHGVPDPHPAWQLWLGCLLPFVNLFWAPVFVMELAQVEGRLAWLRGTIVTWWCAWWVSTGVSVFSIATSFAGDAQGIANNTVATTIAYLAALAALLLTLRVYRGFSDHATVARPVRRWVVVPDDSGRAETATGQDLGDADSAPPVEPARDEPAA